MAVDEFCLILSALSFKQVTLARKKLNPLNEPTSSIKNQPKPNVNNRIPSVGAVVIGRNEGERLKRCLRSLTGHVRHIVYVDSGSTDDSVDFARSVNADVVELDPYPSFTMGRARNAGLTQLVELGTGTEYVQFLDGDCEIVAGWLENAQGVLVDQPNVAVVSGRRIERNREDSIYNRLCDLEWDTPIGEARSCHGDAMMRIGALDEIGAFDERMIAGEEPELCVRLRRAGWSILRIDAPMSLHDAAMERLGQWWRRAQRSGYAYAEGAWLHGLTEERHNLRPLSSILFWGLAVPAIAVGFAWQSHGLSLIVAILAYATLWTKIQLWQRSRNRSTKDAALYATFTLLGKFAQTMGVLRFVWCRLALRRQSGLIEYKVVPVKAAETRRGRNH